MRILYCIIFGLIIFLIVYRQDVFSQGYDGLCPSYYEPVCGDDAKTYSNSCYARNAGVQNYISGECWFSDDGVFAIFGFVGEDYTYRMYISDEQAVEDVIDNCLGLNNNNIPVGAVMNGTLFDPQWSFFLDPESIVMAEYAAEVCDGSPENVEENLGYWLKLGFWCPWAAHVIEIEDFGECTGLLEN